MRSFTLALDSVPILRDAASAFDCDLGAAATLAGLAGVDAVRLGLAEELRPVSEADVHGMRRVARSLELRLPPSQALLKLVLEARPDRVVLCGEGFDRPGAGMPIDLLSQDAALVPVLRSLDEAGLSAALVIAPELEAVKSAHALGVRSVELYTGAIVDLPARERAVELERLGDAARLAAKLRLSLSLGGGIGYRSVPELIRAAPSAECIAAGRALAARALLVGIDRAARDFRALLG